jgi:glycosyl hydrolase family 20
MSFATDSRAQAPGAEAYRIIPAPVSIKFSGKSQPSGQPGRVLLAPSSTPADSFAAAELNAWLEEKSFLPLAVEAGGSPVSGDILLGDPSDKMIAARLVSAGVKADGLGEQGYVLIVDSEGTVAAAAGEAGRFYALMSLAQLAQRSSEGWTLPEVVIRDKPSLGLRGVSDDISRGQTSMMEDFKQLVRTMARWKMNLYTPYMEDMFELTSHPGFTQDRGAFSAEQARELCKYAARYHVRVVPIFQCLGHLENVLKEPEYEPLAEFPGAHCLSPAVEETYDFIGDALTEVAAAFDDEFLHVGCDESWDIGRGQSRAMKKQHGLSGTHAIHYNKVHTMVTDLDRRMLMYGDIILNNPRILDKIDRNIVIVDWHYNAAKNFPSVKKFRGAGFDVIVSPSVRNYNKIFPEWGRALTNIENLTLEGIRNGALGSLISCWGDNGAFSFRQYNLWGYAFGAAVAWNHKRTDRKALEAAFWRSLLGVEDTASLIEANALLATLGRRFTLYDWWRHPLMGLSTSGPVREKKDPLAAGRAMADDMDHALDLLATVDASHNRWYLDLLTFAAQSGRLLADKYSYNGEAESGAGIEILRERALSLHRGAHRLRTRYSDLWRSRNHPAGLENNLRLWNRQLDGWAGAVQALTDGRLPEAPDTPSRWIAPRGSSKAKRLRRPRSSYIRCEFNVDTGADSALPEMLVQLMGESHVEAWLNGKHFGHVTARRSLSLIVEFERAKIYDVGNMLVTGRNVLAIKVTNYEGRTPGANVYAELYAKDHTVDDRILSVPGWSGLETENPPEGWSDLEFEGNWKPCEKYSLGARVSTPKLRQGINSRIQR